MSWILDLDATLYEWINNDLSNAFFDTLLPLWRNKYFWLPVYLFIIAFSWINYKKKGYYLILFVILCAGTSDLISSHLIKKNIQRSRPCNSSEVTTIQRVRCGSGYSFTSSHASNHFALSVFLFLTLGRRFKKIKPWLIFWAASISFAQIYVGVHYPLDVLAGACLGTLIALLYYRIYARSDLAYDWRSSTA